MWGVLEHERGWYVEREMGGQGDGCGGECGVDRGVNPLTTHCFGEGARRRHGAKDAGIKEGEAGEKRENWGEREAEWG